MKKIILIIALIFTTSLFAQYNLEFSKVLNFNIGGDIAFVTVPEGKAWKVESSANNVTFRLTSTNQPYGNNLTLSNHSPMQFGDVTAGKPVWLGAGSSIHVEGGAQNWFSVLEFSLVTASSSGGGGSGDSGSGGSGSGSSSGFSFNDNSGVPDNDFTDPNGNTYGTTNINGMVWTTSNYQGTTYSDGTPIPYISSWDEWTSATTGAYTYWLQDESLGYGKLYNLHALRGRHDDNPDTPNKQFAPDGWHVPSIVEMNYISSLYNDTAEINSYALKSTTGWINGTNGTNISGLDIKPYGAIWDANNADRGFSSISGISQTDIISLIGGYTLFWTSTPLSGNPLRSNSAKYFTYEGQYDSDGFSYTPYLPGPVNSNEYFNYGFYVRLIKDY